MSRQSLPDLLSNTDGNSFFPSFQREMNRLLEQFRNGMPTPEASWSAGFGSAAFPAIDVVETNENVTVSAEVPGVSEEDIDVSITDKVLTLKGQKSAEHETSEDGAHIIERRYGSFRRIIPLGFAPAEDAVKANFADGVLTLTIAKPAETQAAVRKIDIRKS